MIAEIGTAFSETGIAIERPKAVVLLSGGIDSAVTLAIAQSRGFDCTCLTFRYGGESQALEVAKATELAADGGVRKAWLAGRGVESEPVGFVVPLPHVVIEIGLRAFGAVPIADLVAPGGAVFLSFADELAESIGAHHIFADAASALALDTTLESPLIGKTKAQIIHEGLNLGVDMAATHSCTSPRQDADLGQPVACGRCEKCRQRAEGFAAVGLGDPALFDGRDVVAGVAAADAARIEGRR